ncbi:KH domain-containing, RNA-binding, signal transduction-associated protein 2-like [Sycon ciliatum]|uniref:KH domain-containing, RNA-binding, signal transduction-associated protein 2-like n=1 Tax=Sycon ciliatum TaxID=27933 RepID=UPI0020AE78C2|eukprot:scpid45982/ scgid0833/ KH domain-containing, RNA-binding, signal transduction-associated protein 2
MSQYNSEDPAASRDSYISELSVEKENLSASFVHCLRLLSEEIERVKTGGHQMKSSSQVTLTEKIDVPVKDFPGFNFVGRLLGPRGLTLKRMQTETNCRMTIMGRGSIRDPAKEEELRISGDPKYEHLKENLYVFIEAKGSQAIASARLAAGIAEVRKMLIPCEFDQIREEQLRELAVLNGLRNQNSMAEQASNAAVAAAAAAAAAADYHSQRPSAPQANGGHIINGELYTPVATSCSQQQVTADPFGEIRAYAASPAPPPTRSSYSAPVRGAHPSAMEHSRGRGRGRGLPRSNATNSRGRSDEAFVARRLPSMGLAPGQASGYTLSDTALELIGDYDADFAPPPPIPRSGAYSTYSTATSASRNAEVSAAAAAASAHELTAWHKAPPGIPSAVQYSAAVQARYRPY